MARTNATNFTGGLQFPYATAATDVFHKEDIQTLAQAVDQHDHTTGKGLAVAAANASITNAQLGPDVARANLLSNGSFDVWQRGSGPFSAQAAYCADRWQINLAGTDTLSVSKDTTNKDTGSAACAAVTFTLGTGAGSSCLLSNLGPTADGQQVFSRPLSFSMRVRTSTANAVRIALYTGTAYTYSAFHSGGGAYETLTVTATMNASGAAVGQVGVFFAASCTAYLDNAMQVVGSQPANYAPLTPADELARCLRYYEIVGGATPAANDGATYWEGMASGASQLFSWPLVYKATKAVSPTVTIVGTWNVTNCTGPTLPVGVGVQQTSIRLTSAASGAFSARNLAAGTVITIEGNP